MPPQALPVPPLSCADVGISEFVSGDVPGIGGRVKCYPEDFQVNEIRLRDGNVCRGSFNMVQCDGRGHLLLGTDHWPTEGEEEDVSVLDPLPPECIRKDEESFRFTMLKRHADTLEALAELSSVLHVPPRTFSFAGIKDSWAVTAQEVCARLTDVTPRDIASAVYEHIPWMRVEQFHMIPTTEGPGGWLAPGRLLGNRFAIVIRNAAPADAGLGDVDQAICKAVKTVEEFGFVNYVGLQRFAKGGIRSDLVGLAYLRRDYVGCVEGMLNGVGRHPAECAEGASAAINRPRAHWIDVWKRTNSPSATLRAGLPASSWAEKRVLMGMDAALRRKRDWSAACRDAFLSLPKTIRTLYVHAYLDRLWNLTVSERIQRGGARCVAPGDVVALDSRPLGLCDEAEEPDYFWDAREATDISDPEEEGRLHRSARAEAAAPHDGPLTPGDAGAGDGPLALLSTMASTRPKRLKIVTEKEAAEGSFSIFDVVVPRAGAGLSPEVLATPAGKMLERYLWYDELDVLGLEVELCQQSTEEEGWVQIKSAYRRLIARPSEINLHFPPPPQHGSKRRRSTRSVGAPEAMGSHPSRRGPAGVPPEQFVSRQAQAAPDFCPLPPAADLEADSSQRTGRDFKVDFSLGSGQYATMLLREIMDQSKRAAPGPSRKHIVFPDSDASEDEA